MRKHPLFSLLSTRFVHYSNLDYLSLSIMDKKIYLTYNNMVLFENKATSFETENI